VVDGTVIKIDDVQLHVRRGPARTNDQRVLVDTLRKPSATVLVGNVNSMARERSSCEELATPR
jgi:hypothetical protein